jgi:hypothetical protein
MNHGLVASHHIFKCGMIAPAALPQPFRFLAHIDHVALLLGKTAGGDESFELFLKSFARLEG